MYNVYKKYKKESSHSKLITKSNDNVLLDVYYYVRLFTILIPMLFCNRDITQSRCIWNPIPQVHIFWKCYVIVWLSYYVEYLPFNTFVRTCNRNCNGARMGMCEHVVTMLWIHLCGNSFYGDVILWNHMRIVWKKVLVV